MLSLRRLFGCSFPYSVDCLSRDWSTLQSGCRHLDTDQHVPVLPNLGQYRTSPLHADVAIDCAILTAVTKFMSTSRHASSNDTLVLTMKFMSTQCRAFRNEISSKHCPFPLPSTHDITYDWPHSWQINKLILRIKGGLRAKTTSNVRTSSAIWRLRTGADRTAAGACCQISLGGPWPPQPLR